MTVDLIREPEEKAGHTAPLAAHLFGAMPHDTSARCLTMRRLERDHFAAHFAQDFAAALTEARTESLAS